MDNHVKNDEIAIEKIKNMNLRDRAFRWLDSNKRVSSTEESLPISQYFGRNVFNKEKQEAYLSSQTFGDLQQAIEEGRKIKMELADQVASGIKRWAIDQGVTHYTHWFQPLSGTTAEKHESFFRFKDGKGLELFEGTALVQQEPNASWFPTGGLRSTFEARGFTAWDPSSPAFIMAIGNGKTLCIPTIFVSYTGEALDYKAPLLKSIHFLEENAVPVCNYFDRFVEKTIPMLGCEQEFYIIDEAFYETRPDLKYTNRTLVGNPHPKGQEISDHYFGAIPERIYAFLLELEKEAHQLGIPLRTRHNEVGPGQFELAPEFEEVNIAIDHNLLLMDLMQRIAKRHHLVVLLHEKPFKGFNGSAKHNNWSIQTNTGKNLFAPADTPRKNLMFLTFLLNALKAIKDNAEILRACIASSGNECRLGKDGAPPDVITVFIGDRLTEVIKALESKSDDFVLNEELKQELKLDIHNKIPDLLLDNTDKNRTSPIAFTGEKFEIRQVGSSHNPSSPVIVMNTILGAQLKQFRKEVEAIIKKEKVKKDTAILRILRKMIPDCKSILFSGDHYGEAWEKEIKKRGFVSVPNCPLALKAYNTEAAFQLFGNANILTANELSARHTNLLDRYQNEIITEVNVFEEICNRHILPVAYEAQSELALSIQHLRAVDIKGSNIKRPKQLLENLCETSQQLYENLTTLQSLLPQIEKYQSKYEKALFAAEEIRPFLEQSRVYADQLEHLIADAKWPIPKYLDMLKH